MGKATKTRTKTFLKKGLLDGQIRQRHQARQFKQKVAGRAARRNNIVKDRKVAEVEEVDEIDLPAATKEDDDDSDDDEEMNVDDVLGAEGLAEEEEEEGGLEDDDLSDLGEDGSEEGDHVADLKALAEKDPEFFKYLQENDQELLDFGAEGSAEDDDDEDEDEEDDEEEEDSEGEEVDVKGKKALKEKKVKPTPVLTKEVLRSWQKSLLETHSLRTLRKLLLAFRSAASPETVVGNTDAWEIRSPALFNKLVLTTLRYTPVVLAHHVPYKETSAGKYKLSNSSKSYLTSQRLLKSFFVSLQSLVDSVARTSSLPALAVTEAARLLPWVVGNKKVARGWLKMLLALFESPAATDELRVAAFLALRKLAVASDHSIRESVLKGVYSILLSLLKSTSIHTLPTQTLVKNAASELWLLKGKQEEGLSYELAFGYIRMLAMLLRKGVKEGDKDSFKSVYNWQFVHLIDFWSLVLSSSHSSHSPSPSPLAPLLYPLIQVALGALRLVPTPRYYPLRLHLIRSLLRITQKTKTFIPLNPTLFEMLSNPDVIGGKGSKNSTLKPLDLEYFLKVPTKYLKTRVYADSLGEEIISLFTSVLSSQSLSIAFPELALPVLVSLRRIIKKIDSGNRGNGKLKTSLKLLVEKVERNSKWIEEKREKLEFAPKQREKVERFLEGEEEEKSPLGGYEKLMRRVRDQKRGLLEKAARDDDEEEDDA